jgi:hypothetical protein
MYAPSTSLDLWPVCFITTYSGTPFLIAWLTCNRYDRHIIAYSHRLFLALCTQDSH